MPVTMTGDHKAVVVKTLVTVIGDHKAGVVTTSITVTTVQVSWHQSWWPHWSRWQMTKMVWWHQSWWQVSTLQVWWQHQIHRWPKWCGDTSHGDKCPQCRCGDNTRFTDDLNGVTPGTVTSVHNAGTVTTRFTMTGDGNTGAEITPVPMTDIHNAGVVATPDSWWKVTTMCWSWCQHRSRWQVDHTRNTVERTTQLRKWSKREDHVKKWSRHEGHVKSNDTSVVKVIKKQGPQ